MTIEERFWNKVDVGDPEECWNWTASIDSSGYGQIGYEHRLIHAQRLSWIIHNGEIPKGICVLHKCDNPPCVNPSHLFLGTHQDNSDDKRAKGRGGYTGVLGSKHPAAKLTEENVLEIRHLYPSGKFTQKELGEMYGVVHTAISRIINRKRWDHI